MQEDEQFFLKAKKSLGQHFLRSEKALYTIVGNIQVDTLYDDPRGSSCIFEIGPGEGVLTEKLLEKGFTVFTIEIDKRSIEILKQKFAKFISNKKLFIIEQDCLEINYSALLPGGQGYKVVGNIPYYITGAIFRHTFEQKVLPQQVIFLVQKEVAQRVVANDKKESLLSVSVKIFCEQTKILEIVKKGSFVPPPKVDSAIISMKNISTPFKSIEDQEVFFKILRASFSHKRKLMLTNLKTDLEKNLQEKYLEKVREIIIKNNGEKARAEDVSIQTWMRIIEII